jgi:hypothetical protein
MKTRFITIRLNNTRTSTMAHHAFYTPFWYIHPFSTLTPFSASE